MSDLSDQEYISDIEDITDTDESSGEDLQENAVRDNQANAALDQFDPALLGSETENSASDIMGHRALMQNMMMQDQRQGNRHKRRIDVGLGSDSQSDLSQNMHQLQTGHFENLSVDIYNATSTDLVDKNSQMYHSLVSNISSTLQQFSDETGSLPYVSKINAMAETNKTTISIDFQDIRDELAPVANLLIENPKAMFEIFNRAIHALVSGWFQGYKDVAVQARFFNLDNHVKLVDLRHTHMDRLISVHGVVVKRSNVFPKLQNVIYECRLCGELSPMMTLPLVPGESNAAMNKPRCGGCSSKKMFISQLNSQFENFQKLTIQESPNAVQAGCIPRQLDVVLFGDLIDSCVPGEEVEVIGFVQLLPDSFMNRQTGFPIYSTLFVANNIIQQKTNSFTSAVADDLTSVEQQNLFQLVSKWPNIQDIIIRSIAPSIYGHEDIKTAIALSLFGGCAKHLESRQRLRGDINVLMVGDPGVAKSQFLKYAEHVGQRTIYTTGKGASAVGLTAAVTRDTTTGEWTLEGGALVLADQGTCLIDEFDKMSDQDRTSIHEAMEQQTISISKAGIVCTLKARCGVIAAANPIGGMYNPCMTFQEQVNLTEPILSRFDIMCVVRDKINAQSDARLAKFVTSSHMMAKSDAHLAQQSQLPALHGPHGDDIYQDLDNHIQSIGAVDDDEENIEIEQMFQRGRLTQRFLASYIAYAKKEIEPSLRNINTEKITAFYLKLRQNAAAHQGIQITPRHLESVIRMSESFAKMRLSSIVDDQDVDRAIQVMMHSFLESQKITVKDALAKNFTQYCRPVVDKDALILDQIQYLRRIKLQSRSVSAHGTSASIGAGELILISFAEIERSLSTKLDDYPVSQFLTSDTFRTCNFLRYDYQTHPNQFIVLPDQNTMFQMAISHTSIDPIRRF